MTIPECRSDHHGSCTSTAWSRRSVCSLYHPRASLGFQAFFANSPLGVSQFTKLLLFVALALLLLCSLLCSCFAHCCHDPFIVRSASNLSTVPWFHSVCASVSMFTIIDNCLFLFLFLGRYLDTPRASVQTSRPLHLHRSKPPRVHTKSVYVRTKSAFLLRCAQHRICRLCARSIIGLSPSS